MGHASESIHVGLLLNNNNGEQQEADRAAAEELRDRIEQLANEDPRFKRIVMYVSGGS